MKRTPGTVLITGASSGIGRALVLEYARRGAHVMAAARREAELTSLCDELTSLCDEVKAAGGRLLSRFSKHLPYALHAWLTRALAGGAR